MFQDRYNGERYQQHFCGLKSPLGSPTVVVGAGAGSLGGAALLSGDDVSGTVQIVVTLGGDAPTANGIIVTVTFAEPFLSGAPRVFLQPANAATWAIVGVGEILDADTLAASFIIRSGATPLAATSATYLWYYQAIGKTL